MQIENSLPDSYRVPTSDSGRDNQLLLKFSSSTHFPMARNRPTLYNLDRMKKKKTVARKRKSASSDSKRKPASAHAADPEMDALQEHFATSPVDFNSLMNLVK